MSNTESVWEVDVPEREGGRTLTGLEYADVVIIGGGMTGVCLAHLLGQKGLDVFLLERFFIGSGTTGKSSAHLSSYWDIGFSKVQQAKGFEAAQFLARTLRLGLEFIGESARGLNEDVGFKYVDGHLYEDPEISPSLDIYKEMEICRHLGYQVEEMSPRQLPFQISAGFKVGNQAEIHPLKFLNAMVARFPKNVKVFENTSVIEFGPGYVKTPQGEVRARHVVQATHSPLGFDVSQTALLPYESYMIAGPPAADFPDGLFWDNAAPYHYSRKAIIDQEECLLIGGADHRTGSPFSEETGFGALENYIRHKGLLTEMKYRWSAQFFEPADTLPFVGKVSKGNLYMASGFSGDGLTMGAASAVLLSEALVSDEKSHEKWFSPRRNFVFHREFWKHNEEVLMAMMKDRIPSGHHSEIPALEPGQGCVQNHPLHPKAFYRDESGSMIEMSAICPHMKGVVHWNADRKSFDCPCHGSRFDCKGRVLEGPALKGLEVLHREPISSQVYNSSDNPPELR